VIRLEDFAVAGFALDRVNEAVAYSAANGNPFKITVVGPESCLAFHKM